jgi:hypothetical protein
MMLVMKKNLLAFIILAATVSLPSFTYQAQQANAIVDKVNGIDVYVYSKPSNPYEVVKSGNASRMTLKGTDGLVNGATEIALKEKADGVILDTRNGKYEAIRYK